MFVCVFGRLFAGALAADLTGTFGSLDSSSKHVAVQLDHWIAPDNVTLDSIFGITGGVGLNPLPTFDWNMFGGTGLYLPTFAIVNQCVGIIVAAFTSVRGT